MPESTGNCRLNLQGIAGKTLFSITGSGVIATAFWHAVLVKKTAFDAPHRKSETAYSRSRDPLIRYFSRQI
jgi:hypothetical protein